MSNIIIHHRSKHHAQNSGYGQLADYLEGEKLPYLTSKFPYRIAKAMANLVSNEYGNYDTMSVIKDYELCKRILKNNEKGIVHYLNGERDIRYGIKLNKIYNNYKFIATFHKPPEILQKTFNPKIFKKLDGAIAVGENQVDFLKNWLNTENVVYIPHGIDTDFFVPNLAIKESKTILFVGQHMRDFDTFNFVIPKLVNLVPDLKVNVVLRKDFTNKIQYNPCITVYSGIDDLQLRTLYQKSTLLFLPLLNSTACNSILEAMACGLPIVTTDVGGNRVYVRKSFGVLAQNKDNDLLIEETINIIKNNSVSELMSQNARLSSLDYDWKLIANKVHSFYK
ncbi:glycosyltransferase family 4 protein [Flavobacterium ponti]|uniref:Glycosyltransferase family 4 protein n=1 Tax=Flavobacterium ponti TaxID=665133 RepID=A0ABV9P4H8_9FLAO